MPDNPADQDPTFAGEPANDAGFNLDVPDATRERPLSAAARRALAEAAARRAQTQAQTDAATEHGGPSGPEPTRYGDWEKKGPGNRFLGSSSALSARDRAAPIAVLAPQSVSRGRALRRPSSTGGSYGLFARAPV